MENDHFLNLAELSCRYYRHLLVWYRGEEHQAGSQRDELALEGVHSERRAGWRQGLWSSDCVIYRNVSQQEEEEEEEKSWGRGQRWRQGKSTSDLLFGPFQLRLFKSCMNALKVPVFVFKHRKEFIYVETVQRAVLTLIPSMRAGFVYFFLYFEELFSISLNTNLPTTFFPATEDFWFLLSLFSYTEFIEPSYQALDVL